MNKLSTEEASLPSAEDNISVARLLGIGLVTRLIVDTGVQIFFPFLPIIARGMGLSTVVLGRLVSLRSLMGLFSPLFGTMADRRGYRFTMRLSLLLMGLGFLAIGLSRSIWPAAVGMALMGLGSFSFVPTLQAYLSNRLPYHQRARGLGILEYAWALSGILGLYLVGQLLDVVSWQLPFFVIGGSLLVASLLYGFLPGVRQKTVGQTAVSPLPPISSRKQIVTFFDLGSNGRSAYATILTSSLLFFGAITIFVSYGTWLFNDFGLSAGALGQVALVMGLADLLGSVSVSLFSDRYGKRQSVLTGAIIACIGFWALPLLQATLVTAVVGLVVARGAFEFGIVSCMTLLSEQSPAHRAKTMTLGTAISSISTGAAAWVSPWLFKQYGLMGMTAVAGTSAFLSILVLLWAVREPEIAPQTKQS